MKRMKKILGLVLAAAMLLSVCAGITGCATPDGQGGTANPGENAYVDERVDSSKTQIYVYSFDGGYGSDWLNAVKLRYEKLHENTSFEEGKLGVQIMINAKKESIDAISSQILDNRDEIYFTEFAYYYTLKADGLLGDITEAVTADLAEYGDAAGTTIESKLAPEQKAYFGIEEEGQTHYYGLPHYSGYEGLIYNVDLFDEKGYYFVDGYDANGTPASIDDYFIYNDTDKKSAGPDGIYDTYDDGLPATYEEFFILCDYISSGSDTPVAWNGANNRDYLNIFLAALTANNEGLEQMSLNFNMGAGAGNQATTLGTIQDGVFVADAQPTVITPDNAAELFRQKGKYEALNFLETLMNTDAYHNKLAFNSGYSHMNAQEDFLYAGHDGGETAPIAMLLDGIWWEAEAKTVFAEMADSMGESMSKENRRFAYMPLPKADKASVGRNTLSDHIYSICFMKANVEEWKQPLCIDFIKFVHSQESLVEFTQITNTPKAFNYTMTEEEMAEMTHFGRSVFTLKQNSDIVYPYGNLPEYINNQGMFGHSLMYKSLIGGTERMWAATAIHEEGVSAEDYFSGMYQYYKDNWRFQ